MRCPLATLLATGILGTVASSVRGQEPATSAAPAAPPSTAAPAPAAPSAKADTPAPTTSSVGDKPVPETGWELAARISFSLPTGDINGLILGAMPLQIDAGRRFSKQLILGVYGYGAVMFPIVGTGFGFGLGAEGQYFLSQPILGLNPWMGAQAGYLLGSLNLGGSSSSFSGPEGGVQAGLDYKKGFGPFAAFNVGSYSGGSGGSQTGEWITIGMRGTYDW